ncbi:AraC family transcriptional regulator [Sphingomonas sp. Leaf357]|uniref:helix-turn-helix transcriptional regulator n=1 Tax=Sphingomonas sp. Leaf357 TaxID=1736350 RepID=UPI0006F792C9|nr:AraC family transcriptional regulator [Sphingomonas sp. Leaf357]KQS04963.1 AraC family transcriptional regulator [Sphingomonas sp. Leaf357]
MERITVSPEMMAIVGPGVIEELGLDSPVVLAFSLGELPVMAVQTAGETNDAVALRLCVTEDACRRLFGHVPTVPATYHLPSDLRSIALAVRDCPLDGAAGITLRGAKSIELLCESFTALLGDALVPANADATLSERDTRRIVHARQIIDEQWREKLTLDTIAGTCGVNRVKLTSGFRALFGLSVADAISERRLGGARQMLLATDLPVSSVGYACGYLSNASFTRAFSRRYGVVPSRLRATAMAA